MEGAIKLENNGSVIPDNITNSNNNAKTIIWQLGRFNNWEIRQYYQNPLTDGSSVKVSLRSLWDTCCDAVWGPQYHQ